MTDTTDPREHCKHGTPRDPNWMCVQCGNEALRQYDDAAYSAIGATTTDPREGGIEHAELLRQLDVRASGAPFVSAVPHTVLMERAAEAIRALEAKVREVEEPQFCEECGKSIHDCNLDYWREKAEKSFADYAELRADRDRLAGEVERLRSTPAAMLMEKNDALTYEVERLRRLSSQVWDGCTCWSYTNQANGHADNCVLTVHAAEVARLTSELEKAREDAERWRYFLSTRPAEHREVTIAANDALRHRAARHAGEGEKE